MRTTPERIREQRLDEIERLTGTKIVRRMADEFEAKVVGVSFVPMYPENLHALKEAMKPRIIPYPMLNGEMAQEQAERAYERICEENGGPFLPPEPLVAVLVRNPENEHDSNAIEVHVPALGDLGFIGHITAPLAMRMAPEIDAGHPWGATVTDVLIHPDHPDRPGISIRCFRAPEEE